MFFTAHPVQTKMRVEEKDILETLEINTTPRSKIPREIELHVTSKFGELSKLLGLTYKSGYLIVQTDKPLYKPRQNSMY